MTLPNMTHEAARGLVHLYLAGKGRKFLDNNQVSFGKGFVQEHKLNKRFQGHSYDIWTDHEIIEIDDYVNTTIYFIFIIF